MVVRRSGRDPGSADRLLERSYELTELARQLDMIDAAGNGRAVIVTGEAGVGKTALLRAFRDAAGPPDRFLWGRCDPLFTPRALGPLLDVAEHVGGRLRELAQDGVKPFVLATRLLEELGAQPTVLVLEDLHWADEATLDVLRLLVGRLEEVSALVVLTYRDDDVAAEHPFRRVLGELVRLGWVDRLPLDRLSEDAVATLAAQHGVDAAELYRTTAGNPFFVTEVLAAGDSAIPPTVRDAVLARVDRMSPQARRLLEVVAINARTTELWLLERLAGDALPGLDECLAPAMLTADDEGVAFRHELARLAVEGTLAPHRRLALHRAALAALVEPPRGPPDLARLASHAEAAGDGDGVLRFAPAAARRAATVGAHREAAAQYERALRHADELGPGERGDLLDQTALQFRLVGRMSDAVDLRRRAAEIFRATDDRVRESGALRAQVEPLWTLGRRGEAESAARAAIDCVTDRDADHELGLAYAALAFVHCTASDVAGTIAAGARALELAERTGDTRTRLQTLTHLAAVRLMRGDDAARTDLETTLATAHRAGMVEEMAAVYCWLTQRAVRCRDHASSTAYVQAGIELCDEHDLGGWRPLLVALRCQQELHAGAWDDAASSSTLVVGSGGSGPATVAALATLGRLRARRGDASPWALLDHALELAEPSGEVQRVPLVAIARCEAAWLEGRDAAALEETERGLEAAQLSGDRWLLGELAQWRRRAGADEAAPPDVAEPYAAALGGDWRRASALWTALGSPYDAALAAADGDDDGARREALEHLHGMGARATATRVARGLRERGARGLPRGPRPQTARNPANLTARELEVVSLVADGLHNADIAERLFISPRTADHHVAAVLRKLHVTSRGHVAEAAARLGLLTER